MTYNDKAIEKLIEYHVENDDCPHTVNLNKSWTCMDVVNDCRKCWEKVLKQEPEVQS